MHGPGVLLSHDATSLVMNNEQVMNRLNVHGDDHSELVFQVYAQSGHLWPRCKLLCGRATA